LKAVLQTKMKMRKEKTPCWCLVYETNAVSSPSSTAQQTSPSNASAILLAKLETINELLLAKARTTDTNHALIEDIVKTMKEHRCCLHTHY
jgi:hypothetical protein